MSCGDDPNPTTVGDCERGENFENILDQGIFTVVDTNVSISNTHFNYKIKLLNAFLVPNRYD